MAPAVARVRSFTASAVGVTCTLASLALARDEVPGLLFRGGTVVPPPVVVVDPALPTGHRAGWKARPVENPALIKTSGTASTTSGETGRRCATDFPVCVHATRQDVRERA